MRRHVCHIPDPVRQKYRVGAETRASLTARADKVQGHAEGPCVPHPRPSASLRESRSCFQLAQIAQRLGMARVEELEHAGGP